MAKVTLPLLGVSAHGMVARQLVYRARAGFTTAGVWKGKADAKSAAQLEQRGRFEGAKEVWPYLDAETRAQFAALVADEHLTAWHGFLRQVLGGIISAFTVGDSLVGGLDLVWVP
jgi:hypothetical protein